jgi:competence protein ComEC
LILIILGLAWIAGIFVGSLICISPLFLIAGVAPFVAIVFNRKNARLLLLIGFSILLFVGGILRSPASIPQNSINLYNDSSIEIQGTVDSDPLPVNGVVRLELSSLQVFQDGVWTGAGGKVLVYTRETRVDYGSRVHVEGTLETPPLLSDFDYAGYLADRGIYSTMSFPETRIVASGEGNAFIGWIYAARHRLSDTLARVLPEPQASLAQGIILGIRSNIPDDLNKDFQSSGATHILAVSGQNLSILAGIMVSLGVWLFGRRRYLYVWLALLIVWTYTVLSGFNTPVIRSAIMASIFLFAEMSGRQKYGLSALVFAAAVMAAVSPAVIRDASFQLSFVSMLGLLLISPFLQNISRGFVSRLPGGWYVSPLNFVFDSFAVTLAALVMVWPLIAFYFGMVSVVAPVSSLFAVPAMTGIIIFGFLAAGLGIAFLPLGQVFGWIAWLFLSYMIAVVEGFAALPHSAVAVGSVNPVFIWIYYAVLAFLIIVISRRKKAKNILSGLKTRLPNWRPAMTGTRWARLAASLFVIAALTLAAAFTLPDDDLHVYFMDVGQGDAILIRQGNQEVLVDGGPDARSVMLQLGKFMPFWDRTIEMVISTHPDSDHLTGLVEVLKRYNVGRIIAPDFSSDRAIYTEWQTLIIEKNEKLLQAVSGERIDLGNGVRLEVLSPVDPPQFPDGSDDNGAVVRLVQGQVSFLLTGDISAQDEFSLLSRKVTLTSSVLKVAHHGSDTSTSMEFLEAVNPRAAVISVGDDNSYGLPRSAVLRRLNDSLGTANVLRTDLDGTIEFITDGSHLWMEKGK